MEPELFTHGRRPPTTRQSHRYIAAQELRMFRIRWAASYRRLQRILVDRPRQTRHQPHRSLANSVPYRLRECIGIGSAAIAFDVRGNHFVGELPKIGPDRFIKQERGAKVPQLFHRADLSLLNPTIESSDSMTLGNLRGMVRRKKCHDFPQTVDRTNHWLNVLVTHGRAS